MDRILQSGKISEIVPFSFDEPLILYPVRHHSPVCSYHLIKTIERYKPEIILIEGPENSSHLLKAVTNENTILPAAFYSFFNDKKKLVSKSGGSYKCYYPFLYSSPEYNAAVQAEKLGVEARFIDLPYSEMLINTAENTGLRRESDKYSYADDSKLVKGRFYKKICEKTGLRDFEEFWEKYFEIGGLYLGTEEFVKQMNVYCQLTRAETEEAELEADGTAAREKYMAGNIMAAMKKYSRVLAVTGGFHTSGIFKLIEDGNFRPPKLHKIAERDQGNYPMAYSYRAADALRGYASGMRYPEFYDKIMKEITASEDPHGIYDSEALNILVRTASAASKKDISVTISDITSAYSMMKGLSALRDTKECGMSEVFDAVTACFIKGEKTVSSALPLELLSDLASGTAVGHIGVKDHIPPLISDFGKKCDELGIKSRSAMPERVEAALFTTKKGIEVSRFMHQLNFLETGFCERLKGPDIRNNRDRSRVREIWQYRWNPEVDSSLIDHTSDGFTIKEACGNYAETILETHRRCRAAAAVAVDLFLMGIDMTKREQELVDEILRSDGDIISIGDGLRSFNTLFGLRRLYGSEDEAPRKYMEYCFDRIITLLPQMAAVTEEKAEDIIGIIKLMYSIASDEINDKMEALESSLLSMTAQKDPEASVLGAAMGILCAIDGKYKETAEKTAAGYLSGSLEIRKKGADYLRGLFTSARDIVFTGNRFLKMTDKLITSMGFDDFLEILPSLKLAFSNFTPSELQQVSKAVGELHGSGGYDILKKAAVDEKFFEYGEEFDRTVCISIGKGELLNES